MHAPSYGATISSLFTYSNGHTRMPSHTTCWPLPSHACRNKACEKGMLAGTGGRSNTLAAGITHIAQAARVYCQAASQQNAATPPNLFHSSLFPFHHHLSFPLLHIIISLLPTRASYHPNQPLSHPSSQPPSSLLPCPRTFCSFSSAVLSHLQNEARAPTG